MQVDAIIVELRLKNSDAFARVDTPLSFHGSERLIAIRPHPVEF